MKSKKLLLGALLAFLALFSSTAAAGDVSTIAIAPLAVNADRDLSFLKKGMGDMLASRLAWENHVSVITSDQVEPSLGKAQGLLSVEKARALGKSLSADYVLYGSVTVFGDAASLDVSVVETAGTGPALTFHKAGRSAGDLIPQVDELASEIGQRVFGRPSALPVAAPSAAAPAPSQVRVEEPVSPYAHPEKLLEEPPTPRVSAAPAPPAVAPPYQAVQPSAAPLPAGVPAVAAPAGSSFVASPAQQGDMWRSPALPFEAVGIAVADTDGDGAMETVVIGKSQVNIYRLVQGRFATVAEIPRPGHVTQVWVDAADVNGNGRAEIFVSAVNANGGKLESFVLEWNGKEYAPIAEKQRWYFRVAAIPGRGPVLFGQRRGVTDVLLEGVSELARVGDGYETAPGGLVISKADSVFGFASGSFADPGVPCTAVLGLDDNLRLFDKGGKKIWMSDSALGGSEKFLTNPSNVAQDGMGNVIYIPQRLIPISHDGREGILVVKHSGVTGRLFARYRSYNGAEFLALFWDGLGLSPAWTTRKLPGYVEDYAVGDMDNDGKLELVAALVKKGLTSDSTTIVALDLDSAPGGAPSAAPPAP